MNVDKKREVIRIENECLKLDPDQIESLMSLLVMDLVRWIKNLDKENKELKKE